MQSLEIVLKNIFGIRKVNKGQIFDLNGFVHDSKEKITQFVFFVPLFQKIRTLIYVNEFSNGATTTNISTMGGGIIE